MRFAKTIQEFNELGGICQYDGLNAEDLLGKPKRKLYKGYLGNLYHIFIDEELHEVSYLTSDEFGRTIKKYAFRK